jgi:hypothetical protein
MWIYEAVKEVLLLAEFFSILMLIKIMKKITDWRQLSEIFDYLD